MVEKLKQFVVKQPALRALLLAGAESVVWLCCQALMEQLTYHPGEFHSEWDGVNYLISAFLCVLIVGAIFSMKISKKFLGVRSIAAFIGGLLSLPIAVMISALSDKVFSLFYYDYRSSV